MWPIATDKCLIPFLGKPLLYHNLKQIKYHLEGEAKLSSSSHLPGERSETEFIIVANPQSKNEIEKVAKELKLAYTIVVQAEPKGMADAVLSAKDLIEGEVLILNAEDQLDSKVYKSVIGMRSKEDVVVAGLKVDQYFPGGYLRIRGGSVKGIVEKPGEGQEPSDMVKLVVDYFKNGKRLLEYLEKVTSNRDDIYEVALNKMMEDGMDTRFVRYDGIWIPLKYPWQILDILGALLSNIEQNISPGVKVSEKATISGPVVIEEGVKVFEGAVIKGPCYIGKNVIVGNNSMVRESDLEEGCVTGFNSDITRSYIGANSWFHTNYVGDSVIEGDFGMGSGAVLANLRLDDHTIRVKIGEDKIDSGRHKLGLMVGKGSRVGVNASIMPGIKVGSNSFVGPGVTLYDDVPDNKKVLVKQQLEVTEHTPALTSYDQFREELENK